MKKIFATLAVMTVCGLAIAAELKSGPQAGAKLPGPFHPLNCTGEDAGKKACLVCKHGDNPVALVFARTPEDPAVAKLLQKLDEATAKNEKAEMGSFCIVLTDDDKMPEKLKAMGEKAGLKKLTLAVENPEGPKKYNVSKDADVTVILYVDREIKANHAFKKGDLKDASIDAVVADVSKIVKK